MSEGQEGWVVVELEIEDAPEGRVVDQGDGAETLDQGGPAVGIVAGTGQKPQLDERAVAAVTGAKGSAVVARAGLGERGKRAKVHRGISVIASWNVEGTLGKALVTSPSYLRRGAMLRRRRRPGKDDLRKQAENMMIRTSSGTRSAVRQTGVPSRTWKVRVTP